MFEQVAVVVLMLSTPLSLFLLTRSHAKEQARLWSELHRTQAVAFLTQVGPIASAVYQSADLHDERSDFQRLEDTPHHQNRDTMPIGL